MINTIETRRVLIDDDTRALYKRSDSGSEFFYHRKNPLKQSLTDEKVLYVFFNRTESYPRSIIFKDAYGQEWDLLLDNEVGDFRHLGKTFNRGGEASTSKETMRIPRGKHKRTGGLLLNYKPRLELLVLPPPSEPKPMGLGNMHDTSGHSAIRGPTEPLHSPSLHTTLGQPKEELELVMSNENMTIAQDKAKEQAVENQRDVPSENKKGN